jgi:signal transduction histidine kinase
LTRARRLLPRSLIGQIALVMAVALLVAQAINFALVRSERQRVTQAQLEGPAVTRFLAAAERLTSAERTRPIETRRGRVAIEAESVLRAGAQDEDLTQRLRESAAANGFGFTDARAAIGDEPPPLPQRRAGTPGRLIVDPQERARRLRSLLLSLRLPDGRWVNGQLAIPRPDPWPLVRLGVGTILIYVALLGAMLLVAARLTRPLRELTRAADQFRGPGAAPPIEARGPDDIRQAIDAFNAMSARVAALLDEKDRMLGAIGHDLRTPLASLRIRAESMEPPEERERMVATIEEMAAMLEDTLALARSGRSSEPIRTLDVAALVDALVEEYRAMDRPVSFHGDRVVAPVRPNLLRRAVRNLIDNALHYAGAVEASVRADAKGIVIEIADRGPGIAEAQLELVREPFVRLESSRSRATGGSGLGLALARAAALLHGGELELENRDGGGLVVRLLLPESR